MISSFFVFPLPGMVFFPATAKPLNIFEPRYIKMVDDAVQSNSLIALAFSDYYRLQNYSTLDEMHIQIRRVAGVGKPTVLERKNDNTMLIVLEGRGKVKLGGPIYSPEPYLIHKGEWIEEKTKLEKKNIFRLNRFHKEFVNWLYTNVDDRQRLDLFLSQIEEPEEKINYVCSLMVHDAESQQKLLEVDDINLRLEMLSKFVDTSVQPWSSGGPVATI